MAIIQMSDPISFNGIDLNTIPGWRTTGTDPFRYPTRDLKSYHLAYTNTSATTSAFFSGRNINVRGVLVQPSRELLDAAIATLRRILQPINKTLQLPIEGEQRKFNEVTVGNIAISDVEGGFARIDIEFVTSDTHSYALTSTEALNVINLTSGNKSYPITILGSANALPVITYTVDSVTSGTSKAVSFISPGGNTLTVERTWTATEVLVVDCLNQSVQVNGSDVAFSGNFPEWEVGAQYFNYTDEFTARQVDLNVSYLKRYF